MTDNQRIMMEHAIGGLPRTKSRNYYCVEVGSHDEAEWREVVDKGLAEAGRTINDGGDRYYHVTPRGIEWLQEESEARAEREGATAPPRATESAPEALSLSGFAKTPEAAANAASWERGTKRKPSDRIYMDVEDTALDAPARESKAVDRAAGKYEDSIREKSTEPSEIATIIARDLEADFGPNQRSAAGDLARLMGLEGRVQAIASNLRRKAEDTAPCDIYHDGYKFACRSIAVRLESALKPVPPPTVESRGC